MRASRAFFSADDSPGITSRFSLISRRICACTFGSSGDWARNAFVGLREAPTTSLSAPKVSLSKNVAPDRPRPL